MASTVWTAKSKWWDWQGGGGHAEAWAHAPGCKASPTRHSTAQRPAYLRADCTRVRPKACPTAAITATLPTISIAMAATMVLILAKKSGTEISMPTAWWQGRGPRP